MRLIETNTDLQKGWSIGPWNSELQEAVGFATSGIDEPHLHKTVTEIYLIASGTSRIQVEKRTVSLKSGDILIIEPGEAHTFLESSADYFHFVLHLPALGGIIEPSDKVLVRKEDFILPFEEN